MHQKESYPVERKLDPALAQVNLTATDAEVSAYLLVAPVRLRPVVLYVVAAEDITDWDLTLAAGDTTLASKALTGEAGTVFQIDLEDEVVAAGTAIKVTLAPGDAAEDLTGEQIHISFGFTHSLVAA